MIHVASIDDLRIAAYRHIAAPDQLFDLGLFVAESLLLLLPLMLMLWFIWFMPWWRRRIRRKARSLPEWQLTPE